MPTMPANWLRANTVSLVIAAARRVAEQEGQTDTVTLLKAAEQASVDHQNRISREHRAANQE